MNTWVRRGPVTIFAPRIAAPQVVQQVRLAETWSRRGVLVCCRGHGGGGYRSIPLDGRPHLPAHVRQWLGDSVGHWDGNTLVVDTTNFQDAPSLSGASRNLHVVERFTPIDADTLLYAFTVEDPTVWVAPWTIRQELKRQNDQQNRIYYEPRCHEGNYGLPALLIGSRLDEQAFEEGRGPDPFSFSIFDGAGLQTR